ncbi:hypothetical protein FBU59_004486 [Linderina macrospora]|uniref:Uncharacterized protein n=1 Tax=Linderina macrospora TaxID=4868 RepID=A0ACC1J5K2_9FUNG|nr:hypothetical protein FBU59_004486 [Linderina macrospora]
MLYTTTIGGLPALVSGFAVGLKQLIPDYNVKLFRGAIGFRINDLPGFYTLVAPIMFMLLGNLGGALLVNIGFFEAFIYLRFYKRDGMIHGDRSDAFAFSTFFPDFAQPVVRRIAGGVYWVAVKCRAVVPDEGYQQAADLELGGVIRTNPETGEVLVEAEESDKDRRKALANKALEARLEGRDAGSSTSASAAAASNIRPIKFYIPSDETPQEQVYRELRESACKRDHEFWADNNTRFESGKAEFEQEMVRKTGACTLDDLSIYYKQYQVESYERHLKYNRYLWRRNLAMVGPGIRATEKKESKEGVDRRKEKIKSYY